MVVYLDQNKWIEIARVSNGIDRSERGRALLREVDAALASGCIFPISGLHIIEFSRIKDPKKRARLGRVLWKYSKGVTCAPLERVITFEIENALPMLGFVVQPRSFEYLGKGISHAFTGAIDDHPFWKDHSDIIDEAMLCGSEEYSIEPLYTSSTKHRNNFFGHLKELNATKHELKKSKWDSWLYAMSMIDILDPINEVFSFHKVLWSDMNGLGETKIRAFMDSIPTRKLDIHLHRQVLKNDSYRPRVTDLEDWAGLGTAMCYSDVVVCEKHFADLVARDKFQTKARVETKLDRLFWAIER